ncbi:hypothetical protein LXG23DRAFT_18457, partial [Yarrowia lipolytica]
LLHDKVQTCTSCTSSSSVKPTSYDAPNDIKMTTNDSHDKLVAPMAPMTPLLPTEAEKAEFVTPMEIGIELQSQLEELQKKLAVMEGELGTRIESFEHTLLSIENAIKEEGPSGGSTTALGVNGSGTSSAEDEDIFSDAAEDDKGFPHPDESPIPGFTQ